MWYAHFDKLKALQPQDHGLLTQRILFRRSDRFGSVNTFKYAIEEINLADSGSTLMPEGRQTHRN